MALKADKQIAPKAQKVSKVDFESKAARYKELEKILEAKNKKLEPLNDELNDLKKELIEFANNTAGDDEEVEFRTEFGKVKIGKRSSVRVVTDMAQAVKFMGKDVFMQVAKVNLSDLDKYLTPPQLEQVVESKRSDTRRITG